MLRHAWLGSVLLSLFGCSGSSVVIPDGDAGTNSPGGDAGTGSNPGTALVPTGECKFSIRATDAAPRARQGRASARMNGSGNVIVACESDGEVLELWVGNATYDGPRTYVLDSTRDDGTVNFKSADGARWTPIESVNAGCKVIIAAPAGAAPPKGSVMQGTFECSGLKTVSGEGLLAFENGAFSAPVR